MASFAEATLPALYDIPWSSCLTDISQPNSPTLQWSQQMHPYCSFLIVQRSFPPRASVKNVFNTPEKMNVIVIAAVFPFSFFSELMRQQFAYKSVGWKPG